VKKTKLLLILLGVLISVFAAACVGSREAGYVITQGNRPDLETTPVGRSANDFAFRLSAALLEAEGITHENFVVSPYSVWLPLAALINATMDEYVPALLEALSAGGITPEDINNAAYRMFADLTNERWGPNPLHIVNAIFVDYAHTLREEFAQIFMDYYRGTLMNVNFRSPDAAAIVNQWASDNTNGLINEVIRRFDPNTIAAIANAIYFSDNWSGQFDPELTHRDVFHSPTGENYAYFMERELLLISYFEDRYVQSLTLPFRSGGGMTIILPRNGDAVGLLSSMDTEYFNRIHRNSVFAQGRLVVHQFTIENRLDNLEDALVS